MVVYGVAEEGIDGIHLAPIPSYFDSMADGPFHPAGSSVAFFCDRRIQLLGDMPAAAGEGFYFQL